MKDLPANLDSLAISADRGDMPATAIVLRAAAQRIRDLEDQVTDLVAELRSRSDGEIDF